MLSWRGKEAGPTSATNAQQNAAPTLAVLDGVIPERLKPIVRALTDSIARIIQGTGYIVNYEPVPPYYEKIKPNKESFIRAIEAACRGYYHPDDYGEVAYNTLKMGMTQGDIRTQARGLLKLWGEFISGIRDGSLQVLATKRVTRKLPGETTLPAPGSSTLSLGLLVVGVAPGFGLDQMASLEFGLSSVTIAAIGLIAALAVIGLVIAGLVYIGRWVLKRLSGRGGVLGNIVLSQTRLRQLLPGVARLKPSIAFYSPSFSISILTFGFAVKNIVLIITGLLGAGAFLMSLRGVIAAKSFDKLRALSLDRRSTTSHGFAQDSLRAGVAGGISAAAFGLAVAVGLTMLVAGLAAIGFASVGFASGSFVGVSAALPFMMLGLRRESQSKRIKRIGREILDAASSLGLVMPNAVFSFEVSEKLTGTLAKVRGDYQMDHLTGKIITRLTVTVAKKALKQYPDSSISTFIGHEIGHHHLSKGELVLLTGVVMFLFIALILVDGISDSEFKSYYLGLFFILALLAYLSYWLFTIWHYWKNELKADCLGFIYAYKAGYDLRESIKVWEEWVHKERVIKKTLKNIARYLLKPPHHPSASLRVKNLKALISLLESSPGLDLSVLALEISKLSWFRTFFLPRVIDSLADSVRSLVPIRVAAEAAAEEAAAAKVAAI